MDPICLACLSDPDGLRADVPMSELAPGRPSARKGFKKNRKTSIKQEVDIAEELNWRTQPGSGNQRGAKGDVRGKDIGRLEAKFTRADSFSLKLDELYKIAGECTGNEKPVFVIDFLDPASRKLRDRFAVINFIDFKEMILAPR